MSNQIQELLTFYKLRAYGLCWLLPNEAFQLALEEFERVCCDHYGSLEAELSSPTRFEIWAHTT